MMRGLWGENRWPKGKVGEDLERCVSAGVRKVLCHRSLVVYTEGIKVISWFIFDDTLNLFLR